MEQVMRWFREISKIPRGSGNMGGIADFCVQFAKERNLWYKRDELDNIIIKKPASVGYGDKEPVILQAHLDTQKGD